MSLAGCELGAYQSPHEGYRVPGYQGTRRSKNSPGAPRNTVPRYTSTTGVSGLPDVGTDWQMWRIWLGALASGTSLSSAEVLGGATFGTRYLTRTDL
eukprot:1791106-Rhodomonas_salina.1